MAENTPIHAACFNSQQYDTQKDYFNKDCAHKVSHQMFLTIKRVSSILNADDLANLAENTLISRGGPPTKTPK